MLKIEETKGSKNDICITHFIVKNNIYFYLILY
jgi:hypothetical protein